jgi:hypothetical protein
MRSVRAAAHKDVNRLHSRLQSCSHAHGLRDISSAVDACSLPQGTRRCLTRGRAPGQGVHGREKRAWRKCIDGQACLSRPHEL